MDKIKTIEGKITAFFAEKAKQRKIEANQLKLIISLRINKDAEPILRYELWDTIGSMCEDVSLETILKLNMIERFYASEKSVEKTLMQTIEKFAGAEHCLSTQIQLRLLPTLEYAVLKERKKIKDITLNQIL